MANIKKAVKTKGKLELQLKREPSTMVSMRFPVWLFEAMQECLQVCRENSDGTVTFSSVLQYHQCWQFDDAGPCIGYHTCESAGDVQRGPEENAGPHGANRVNVTSDGCSDFEVLCG